MKLISNVDCGLPLCVPGYWSKTDQSTTLDVSSLLNHSTGFVLYILPAYLTGTPARVTMLPCYHVIETLREPT
eukprot:2288157-Prymnesium_polylepis.1